MAAMFSKVPWEVKHLDHSGSLDYWSLLLEHL
jgi:hypothetical protein